MVDISKEDLKKALDKIGQYDRFWQPGRFRLCRQVYNEDMNEKDDTTSVEWECDDYFEEGVDELYKALNENKKICDRK